jgi:hypothetical protein
MTFEKKCFIELSDIIAVQYECGNCRAAISVPIEKISAEYAATLTRQTCPYCQKDSGFASGTDETRCFLDFNAALKNVVGAMRGRNLKMRLDVKCEN